MLAAIAATHVADSSRVVGDRAQLGRSRPRLRALLDAGRHLERPRRNHRRPRLVHRVVSAVRLRPRSSTSCCSRSGSTCSRRCSNRQPVTWSGRTRAPLSDQTVYPPIEPGQTLRVWVGVGGTPRVGRAGRALRLPADARDHRRQPAAVRAVRRSVLPRARSSSGTSRCRSASTRPATSPPPTSRRARSSGRTTRR